MPDQLLVNPGRLSTLTASSLSGLLIPFGTGLVPMFPYVALVVMLSHVEERTLTSIVIQRGLYPIFPTWIGSFLTTGRRGQLVSFHPIWTTSYSPGYRI